MVLGQFLALIISLTDYFTEGIFSKPSPFKIKVISFSAGVSVSYIFLNMLPEIYTGAIGISNLLFLPILFGFSAFHLLEKHIRQYHVKGELRKEHQLVHTASSFLYFFVVGFVLVKITETSSINSILLFIPILLHVIIDSLPRRTTKKHHLRAVFASSAFLGAIAATFVDFGIIVDLSLLGIVGGALLYTVIRESIPKEREGRPLYFAIGLLLFTILIMILWNLGL